MNNTKAIVLGGVIGGVLTALAYTFLFPPGSANPGADQSNEKLPLYWVAPMDPNYRRDKPGKSPMGMDLIPVYEENASGGAGPGTINISPSVENNLGVRTESVQRRALHVPIRTVGYVQYNEDTLVHIHPRVEGWVDTLHVKASGEYVKKGEPLYSLYAPELVNAQEELLIAMRRGNEDLISAARSRLDALQMPKDAIRSLISTKKVRQTITFSAPQTGFVDNLNIREGFFIKPGNTILSIGALDEVWVDAEIFERQSEQVKVGFPVTMTLDFLPGIKWEGEVDYVYPTLEQSTRTLRVRLRFKNQDYVLKPNMFAQITIHADLDSSNVLVPSEAVIRTGTQDRVVLALGDGQFKSIAVDVGRVVNEYTEILTGLSDGDEIVTSAQFLLDSESSISSDFKRMETPDEMPSSVFTEATITGVMPSHNMLTVNHAEISEWDWPEMTMDFIVANHVDIGSLREGMLAHIEIRKENDGQYLITTVHVINDEDDGDSQTATVLGSINAVDVPARTVNISRDAIPKWDRPAATLDFSVSESLNINEFEVGERINFTFEIIDGSFRIIKLETENSEVPMDHSNHEGAH